MKRIFFVSSLALGFLACNNDPTDSTTISADSAAGHARHSQNDSPTSATDSVNSGAQSMMAMMQRNMDQMKSMQSTGNVDKDFAALMRTHHMGALEMAQLQVAQGSDTSLKRMAQEMITAQQQEMTQLGEIGSSITAQQGGNDAFHKKAVEGMNAVKMEMDHSGTVDQQFAQMMMAHHQSGVDMAKTYLQSGPKHAGLKTLANKIIADQQKEIAQLRRWLQK